MEEEANMAVERVRDSLRESLKCNQEYTRIILGVGYVGLFAAWAFTKDTVSESSVLWSALFGLASLLIFILFEVLSMILMTSELLVIDHAASDRILLVRRIQQAKRTIEEIRYHYLKAWATHLILCLVTGLTSAGILMFAIVQSLLMSVC